MDRLRGKHGCPWDREQTHLSLRPYLVEEAYEVVGAIEKGDMGSLQEELGDLLLQVVFHARIAMGEKHFSFYNIVHTLITKLVRRHPHVFGSQRFFSIREVKKEWDQIKKEERGEKLSGVAGTMHIDPALPALMQALKIQEKASHVGFDWKSIEGPLEKVKEEQDELVHAYRGGDRDRIEEELGDLLFAMVNVSRFMGVNPELALMAATKKFADRFAGIEEKAKEKGGGVADFDLNQLDCWWKEIKKKTKKAQGRQES
ncbi:MAG: nucleoside triphosphate pyrophosphohydrolase [Firmicutes bacterium]|nr:nucleoside triphosphate pyrophosphohydrolase [Bacillota bacterium]